LLEKIEQMTTEIFVDIFLYNKQIPIINKLRINIKECNEEYILKKIILDKIIQDNLFSKIFKTDNNFYLDLDKRFMPLAEFIQNFSPPP
jgi:hypothetical protein